MRSLMVLAHRVRNFRKICAFSYSFSFSIKILATDVKTQKIKTVPNFFMTYENFVRSVYFLTCENLVWFMCAKS